MRPISRRSALLGPLGGILGGTLSLATPAIAQDRALRIGMMLPFSGAYAGIGEAIAAAIDLHVKELKGKMGGRTVELIRLDDESDPVKASSNVNALLGRDKADVLVGTVDSDVLTPLIQASREQRMPLIIPHAGNDDATRELCAPSVFRSSFSNWQPAFAMGHALAAKGVRKAACITWNSPAGKESIEGFRDGLRTGGAELTRALTISYPETNFQPVLAALPGLGVEAVGAFFTGAGAIEFVRRYAAAGLRDKLPLCGSGFLTEGLLKQQGAAAEGLLTALHYADSLDNSENIAFRATFKAFCGKDADIYAVQGYDAAQMLAVGLDATRGDTMAIEDMATAILATTINSPRGPFTLSASHNPVQTIWLRQAKNGENRVIGTAAEALADPGTGCKMN